MSVFFWDCFTCPRLSLMISTSRETHIRKSWNLPFCIPVLVGLAALHLLGLCFTLYLVVFGDWDFDANTQTSAEIIFYGILDGVRRVFWTRRIWASSYVDGYE